MENGAKYAFIGEQDLNNKPAGFVRMVN